MWTRLVEQRNTDAVVQQRPALDYRPPLNPEGRQAKLRGGGPSVRYGSAYIPTSTNSLFAGTPATSYNGFLHTQSWKF